MVMLAGSPVSDSISRVGGRRSIRPRESWWMDLVIAEVKVSEVGPNWAKAPCRPRERRKVATGMTMREGRKV